MRYNNYHKHTDYSNIYTPDTHTKPIDYINRAKELGHTTYFTTEHGYGGSIFDSIELCDKYNLQCIYAIEGYIVENPLEKDNSNYHIVIIPRSDKARKRLNVINSKANIEGYYYKPRIFLSDLLESDKEDFYITTACCGGLLKNENSVKNIFMPLYKHFGQNIFLEVQNHNHPSQIAINKRALVLSAALGLRLIHANDSHYIKPEDAKDRLQMLKGKNINYGDEDTYILDYPDSDVVFERYKLQGVLTEEQVREALETTLIFDNIKNNIKIDKTIKMPNIYPDLSVDERISLLKTKVCNGYMEFKKADNITDDEEQLYFKAINEEFKVIEETKEIHTMDYFLFNELMVKKAINEYGGYLTSTSRGSGGAFLLNKTLGLTQLDRIRSEIPLYYERFMSTARLLGDNPPYTSSLPDLDFNVMDAEPFRKASKDLLGENGCYWMLAYGTMKEGEAFRNTCRSKGLMYDEYNEVAKNLDLYREDEKWKPIIEEANKFNGVIISSSPHPCSNILFSGNLQEELGVIKVGDTYCCPITSSEADTWHYLKNDYLTVESIKLTKLTYDMLNKEVDTLYNLKQKLDDKVWDIYGNGLTCAINQFDSLWATSMSKIYKPHNVKEVAMFNGCIRPNFNDYRDSFIHRDETFTNGNSFLDNLFIYTDKYCLYQENLMAYFESLGVAPNESIGLIKKISKKKIKSDDFNKLVERLQNGWIKAVGSLDGFDATWEKILTFMSYGYNSPNSLAMAYDSLYNAYLKSHYPLQFYSVALDNYIGDSERTKRLTEELETFGIKIKSPKFRYSKGRYYPDIATNSIYKGVASIKYMNETMANELYDLKDNHYNDFLQLLEDIQSKTSINNRQLEILIVIGYFEEFGGSQKLLDIIQIYNKLKDKRQFKRSSLPLGLTEEDIEPYAEKKTEKTFTNVDTNSMLKVLVSKIKDRNVPLSTRIKYELDNLGYIDYIDTSYNKNVCIVSDIKINSYGTVFLSLHRVYDGHTTTIKVDKKYYNTKPLQNYEMILLCDVEERVKRKKVDGKWVASDEKELILLSYAKVVEDD